MSKFQGIINAQKTYFSSNVTRSYEWRVEQLTRMGKMISENEAALQQAIIKDFKTASQEYIFETQACFIETEFQKSQLQEWMEPTEMPVPKALAKSGHMGFVYRDPYGVTLVMAPFNGPLLLSLRPAITALAAGNTCVLKLSEALPATTDLLSKLVEKYFDPRAVTTVRGNREETGELLKLQFDFIFFTGSTKVGKIVAHAAAENLTPVILELGGQNPAFVDETANIKDAARKIAWGATAWGGAWCTSPGYAYVHESVAKEFVAEAKKALIEMYGEGPKSNPDFSRIISAKEASRLAALIEPSKVVHGGASDPEARYVEPTILYPITWEDEIMEDEVFGPILPVLTFKTLDEAFGKVRAKPHALAAFMFSRSQANVDRYTNELTFGGGAVNQVNIHLFVESMPFGGVGASGMGHYYGQHGFNSLTHAKSILVSPPDVEIEHLIPPYTDEKNRALALWFDY